jgi:hypothetical protein
MAAYWAPSFKYSTPCSQRNQHGSSLGRRPTSGRILIGLSFVACRAKRKSGFRTTLVTFNTFSISDCLHFRRITPVALDTK